MAQDKPGPTPSEAKTDGRLIGLLRLGAFLCFAGWTWVHFYWEGPYGALLWHDATYQFADGLGMDWDSFVGTGANDGFVQKWISRLWWPFLAFTILTLTTKRSSRAQMVCLCVGSLMLTVVSYAKYVQSHYQLPMFIEHGGQILMPVVLISGLVNGARHAATVAVAMLAVIATFVGHGCYACAIWPTPPSFFAIIAVILGTEHEVNRNLLFIAGLADFGVCVGIFIPALRQPSTLYAACWGFLTAVARPVAGMSTELNYFGADQYVHEAILRAPHFILPLYLFLVWRRRPA